MFHSLHQLDVSSRENCMQINADALLYVLPLGFQCGNFVSLNDMYSSLQIFDNESHASIHSDRTKEGLSLYGKRIIGFYPAIDILFDLRHPQQHKNSSRAITFANLAISPFTFHSGHYCST